MSTSGSTSMGMTVAMGVTARMDRGDTVATRASDRGECAIRSSAVLGFVGAGGLGQQMDASMKMFNGGEVSTMLVVFVLLVVGTDKLSAWLRRVLA